MSEEIEMDKNGQGEYEVGYKKPPENGQFQKGQSGNPKGRPKGAKNLTTIVNEEINQKIVITEGNQQKEVTKLEALIKAIVNGAIAGKSKQVGEALKLIIYNEEMQSRENINQQAIDSDDLQIIENYIGKYVELSPTST